MGQWATGRYEGDGLYAGSGKYSKGDRYNVKLLDTKVDGEIGFSVIEVGEKDRRKWMTLSEAPRVQPCHEDPSQKPDRAAREGEG
jgi:hypothetical protein